MKTAKKAIVLVLCAALLVCASVMGTLAYLQMSTKTVTNTFTVGQVAITLTELEMEDDGVTPGSSRIDVTTVAGTNAYKLIPGHTYKKDPMVSVVAKSEACYVFVKVENGISDIEVAAGDGDTIAEQMATYGWIPLSGVQNVYYKVVDAVTAMAGTDLHIFDTFTIADTVTNAMLEAKKSATISITAYAIQSEGLATAEAAWTAGGFGTPAP